MAAYEDKISGQCEYELCKAASVLEQYTAAVVYIAEQCKAVEIGEGIILACRADHEEEIVETCKKAVSDTTGE